MKRTPKKPTLSPATCGGELQVTISEVAALRREVLLALTPLMLGFSEYLRLLVNNGRCTRDQVQTLLREMGNLVSRPISPGEPLPAVDEKVMVLVAASQGSKKVESDLLDAAAKHFGQFRACAESLREFVMMFRVCVETQVCSAEWAREYVLQIEDLVFGPRLLAAGVPLVPAGVH